MPLLDLLPSLQSQRPAKPQKAVFKESASDLRKSALANLDRLYRMGMISDIQHEAALRSLGFAPATDSLRLPEGGERAAHQGETMEAGNAANQEK